MRALIIDDDDAIRTMLDLVLGLEGFEVHLAPDGPTGLEMARRLQPDVIILDVMMPGLDGYEVARRLRDDPELDTIPVVFCTAKADEEDQWTGWRAGAASYVSKPFDTEFLVAEVLRLIAGGAAVAGGVA